MARSKKIMREKRLYDNISFLEHLQKRIIQGKKNNRMEIEENGDSVKLTPTNTPYKSDEPYFLTFKEEELVLLPHDIFAKLVELLHLSYEEQFRMQLEHEIVKQMPRDFDDIWAIALNELKKSKQHFLKVDPECLVALIKKQHPNLFIHFDSDLWG